MTLISFLGTLSELAILGRRVLIRSIGFPMLALFASLLEYVLTDFFKIGQVNSVLLDPTNTRTFS